MNKSKSCEKKTEARLIFSSDSGGMRFGNKSNKKRREKAKKKKRKNDQRLHGRGGRRYSPSSGLVETMKTTSTYVIAWHLNNKLNEVEGMGSSSRRRR